MNKWRAHAFRQIERHAYRKSWPLGIFQQRKLLPRALRIIAQRLDMKARLGPHPVQRRACVAIRNLAAAANYDLIARRAAPDHLRGKSGSAQPRKHIGNIFCRNLHDHAKLFTEKLCKPHSRQINFEAHPPGKRHLYQRHE